MPGRGGVFGSTEPVMFRGGLGSVSTSIKSVPGDVGGYFNRIVNPEYMPGRGYDNMPGRGGVFGSTEPVMLRGEMGKLFQGAKSVPSDIGSYFNGIANPEYVGYKGTDFDYEPFQLRTGIVNAVNTVGSVSADVGSYLNGILNPEYMPGHGYDNMPGRGGVWGSTEPVMIRGEIGSVSTSIKNIPGDLGDYLNGILNPEYTPNHGVDNMPGRGGVFGSTEPVMLRGGMGKLLQGVGSVPSDIGGYLNGIANPELMPGVGDTFENVDLGSWYDRFLDKIDPDMWGKTKTSTSIKPAAALPWETSVFETKLADIETPAKPVKTVSKSVAITPAMDWQLDLFNNERVYARDVVVTPVRELDFSKMSTLDIDTLVAASRHAVETPVYDFSSLSKDYIDQLTSGKTASTANTGGWKLPGGKIRPVIATSTDFTGINKSYVDDLTHNNMADTGNISARTTIREIKQGNTSQLIITKDPVEQVLSTDPFVEFGKTMDNLPEQTSPRDLALQEFGNAMDKTPNAGRGADPLTLILSERNTQPQWRQTPKKKNSKPLSIPLSPFNTGIVTGNNSSSKPARKNSNDTFISIIMKNGSDVVHSPILYPAQVSSSGQEQNTSHIQDTMTLQATKTITVLQPPSEQVSTYKFPWQSTNKRQARRVKKVSVGRMEWNNPTERWLDKFVSTSTKKPKSKINTKQKKSKKNSGSAYINRLLNPSRVRRRQL
jgi:hypothetical protein